MVERIKPPRTTEGNVDVAPDVLTRLAQCPKGTLLDQKALAAALSVSPRTIRRMVTRYELPPGIKLGGRKIWIAERVLEYLSERSDRLAREATQHVAHLRELL